MDSRWLALPLALLTGCATVGPTTSVRMHSLPSDLQLGAMSQRTSFELDDSRDAPVATASYDSDDDSPQTDKQERRRKILFFLGVGAAGFGVLGGLGFGIGGRVVQAQLSNGYDDNSLTRDREDTLTTRGEVMNGMMIGSVVVGLAGIILASTVYGIDHVRCGDLPPRRKDCPDR
ncbi:MAG: hypothetical protein AB1Z98_02605, partial [Nannocystaceae bacterium]